MLSLEEAVARILPHFHRLEGETVPLLESLGRVLHDDLRADADIPPFANSSMDGFALLASDVETASPDSPVRLPVVSLIPAGQTERGSVGKGECARIMTGAPLPSGTDAVIPFEDVTDAGEFIEIRHSVSAGACVRPSGNDIKRGDPVLESCTELGPPHIGLLATLGLDKIGVTRRPLVAILATGDELVSPGTPLGYGQIYDSNTPMLATAVQDAGGTARTFRAVEDTAEGLRSALLQTEGSDLIITSGGASVGDFDYVKEVIGGLGELSFWRVRIRPGKPLLFGHISHTPVVGLPGNPSSALVTFEQFVRPAIRKMLGAGLYRPTVTATVGDRIDNRGGRRTFARIRLRMESGRVIASLAGSQDSAMLRPLAHADGLLIIPEEIEEMRAGDSATVQVWNSSSIGS